MANLMPVLLLRYLLYHSVPTCPEEIANLSKNVNKLILSDKLSNEFYVQIGDVKNAIKSLKLGKDDGNFHLVSDHIIMSTDN